MLANDMVKIIINTLRKGIKIDNYSIKKDVIGFYLEKLKNGN